LDYWTQQIKKGHLAARVHGPGAALGVTTASGDDDCLAEAGICGEPSAAARPSSASPMARRPTPPIPLPSRHGDADSIWGAMSNSLTEVDAKGNIQPDLATSFEPATRRGPGSSR